MTRFLSSALEAPEPFFRLGLRQLESANGNPNTDIRFSNEITHAARQKIFELGLDPRDTTPNELFKALEQRIKADDARLTKQLRTQAATHLSAEADVVGGMVHAIQNLTDSKRCFALKNSSLRSIFKAMPPKKAMKRLGYRSVDSFLKHESPVLVMASAWLVEGSGWQKRLLDQYKKLQPSDFENREIQIMSPNTSRWQELSADVVEQKRHNLLSFKELGALVFLPLPKEVPSGAVTVSFSLALHELNEIRAASSFLKLGQVKPDFGQSVHNIVASEPQLSSELLDQPVPWHLIQRYYGRLKHYFREEIFEPYLQMEDMAWYPVEKTLSSIEPSFSFWHHSGHLAIMDGSKAVSLNLIDAALNYCNKIPFERRAAHYLQRSLWHELLLRYLHHGPVEQSVLTELQPQLAAETVRI